MSRIFVGLSGGVDSSVAATLLKAEGHEVTGVYMKNWTEDLPGMKCPWADDLADAKRVAVQLGMDFKVFDFQRAYRQQVVETMIAEYEAGRTPNPDIRCNQEIKFRLFLQTALEEGAEMIATGHYAKVRASHESRVTSHELLKAKDEQKDQTYFLYRVAEEALGRTLFPLGEMTKPEVRAKAAKLGLVTADKKDSQGICFVGEVGIKEFLQQYVKARPGDIIDKKTGAVIGRHDGALYYTIGQRHGLGVGGGLPYYVAGKDLSRNVVLVTTNLADENLWRTSFTLQDLHWINRPPEEGRSYQVRTRHRAKLIDCQVAFKSQAALMLTLQEAERAITPGQSAVLYEDERVVGGGIVV